MTMTEREQLIEKLHKPARYTLEEVQELRAEVQIWMINYPGDAEVLGAGESLAMLEKWLTKSQSLVS